MFDVNVSPIDIEGEGYDTSNVFEPEPSSHRHEVEVCFANNLGSTNSLLCPMIFGRSSK
jgi:hypothetical protein